MNTDFTVQFTVQKHLEIIGKVTVDFQKIILEFREFLLNNILDKVEDLDEINYRPILTKSSSDKIMQELIKFAST